jgi:iron-sulfur cluster repair protein YtfE (RIC family)
MVKQLAAVLVHVHEMLRFSSKRTKLRPWAIAGLGAAGGMLMGRLLPILIANANGVARARFGEDPFAGLIREHRQLLALLEKMENTPHHRSLRRGTLFFLFKRKIAKHAMAEEDVVYPMLTDYAERADAARKLYEEHGRMKVLLFELEQSINDDQGWLKAVTSLRSEIEPHARQEEEVEFPALRTRMDMPGKVKLARKIHEEEAGIV